MPVQVRGCTAATPTRAMPSPPNRTAEPLCLRPLPGPGIEATPCFCRAHLGPDMLHAALPRSGNLYALLMPDLDASAAPRSRWQ